MSRAEGWVARVNWRREAIYPSLAVAEISLITPWMLAFLSNGNRFPPEVAARATLALVLGTLYLTRVMDALRVRTLIQRVAILAVMLGTILLALRLIVFTGPQWAGWELLRAPFIHLFSLSRLVPDELIVTLGVILLFWRGLRLARKSLSTFDVMMGFQIGIVLLALFVMINTVTTGQDITIFVPSFFFCQLLAVGLTRVETIWQERGGRRSPFTGWWLAALVGSTGAVIGLAGAISAAVLGIGPDKLLYWLGPILAIITLPIALIMLPIIALLGMIAEVLSRALINFQWPAILQQLQTLSDGQATEMPLVVRLAARVIVGTIKYGKGILTILVVLAALIGVVWVIGRWRARREGEEGELHESIWSSRALLKKLAAQLQRRLAGFKNLANLASRFGAGGLFTALTIRRIYAQTVRLAASRGYPRPAARTPYEHLATLRQALPGCEAELTLITEAYVGVHYGELPENPDALAEIRAAFERVKTVAQSLSHRPTDQPVTQ